MVHACRAIALPAWPIFLGEYCCCVRLSGHTFGHTLLSTSECPCCLTTCLLFTPSPSPPSSTPPLPPPQAQYTDTVRFLDSVSLHRKCLQVAHLRPLMSVSADPSAWWRFAVEGVRQLTATYKQGTTRYSGAVANSHANLESQVLGMLFVFSDLMGDLARMHLECPGHR